MTRSALINTHADFLGLAQYENEERRADFNLRFHWVPVPGNDFYVVWNSGFTTDPEAPCAFARLVRCRTH